jgi:hypothetical protein
MWTCSPSTGVSTQQKTRAPRACWSGALFDLVLRQHRALHATDKPLVRADFDHALDVWQWVLRLRPTASLALQIAALFHDIERLRSEPDVRIEQRAGDYQQFKVRHAEVGASMLYAALASLPIPEDTLTRAMALVARHEQPDGDAELALLNDADALSFFALNSPGFVRYFDEAHSAKKVAYTLARMSPEARAWLPALRLERRVDVLLQRARSQPA